LKPEKKPQNTRDEQQVDDSLPFGYVAAVEIENGLIAGIWAQYSSDRNISFDTIGHTSRPTHFPGVPLHQSDT